MTETTTVTLFGGFSFYLEAFLDQLKHMFTLIDNSVARKDDDQKIKKEIFETIVLHNRVVDMFELLCEIYSTAIFYHLICAVLFLAAALYQVEMVI